MSELRKLKLTIEGEDQEISIKEWGVGGSEFIPERQVMLKGDSPPFYSYFELPKKVKEALKNPDTDSITVRKEELPKDWELG